MIYKRVFVAFSLLILSSCLPENVKTDFSDAIVNSQRMLADKEFKKALAHIELYKLRNGVYPASLNDLEYLNAMDSSMHSAVQYVGMDSVYELNNIFPGMMVKRKQTIVPLKYPEEFWVGLGCIKSNAK